MKQTTEDTLTRRQLLFSVMTDIMIAMVEQRRSSVVVGVPSKGSSELLECE